MRLTIEFIWENDSEKLLPPEINASETEKICEECAFAVLQCDNFLHDALISIELTDGEGIRELNKNMRQIDSQTDVLSFPAIKLKAGEKSEFRPKRSQIDIGANAVFLGDMAISIPAAVFQAKEYGHSFKREIGFLCAHSTAHLLGYDHMTDADKGKMRALEERAMKLAGYERI